KFTRTRHALTIQHIKLRLTEGRSQFVFDDPDTRTIPYHLLSTLQDVGPSHIETHRGVKLEGIATGGHFRIAKRDTNLLAQLIDEDHTRLGFANHGSQLAQTLR